MSVYKISYSKKINLIFLIFLLLTDSIFCEEINHLVLAIESFKKGDLKLTKFYLNEGESKNQLFLNQYESLKLNYIISLIENNYFNAEEYYNLLQKKNNNDDFIIIIRINHLLVFHQYEKIKELLNQIDYSRFIEPIENKYTVLPFACEVSDNPFTYSNIIKNKKYGILWRYQLTDKEIKFLINLNYILNDKKDPDNFLSKCSAFLLDHNPQKYHIYRLFLYSKQDIYIYYNFFLFLLKQKKFIEALHILRTIYSRISINQFNHEFYIIMLNFKKLYEKLGYTQQVDSLERFLAILEMNHYKNIDIVELKKIATENKNLREFLWFLYMLESTEDKKDDYWNQIKQYDDKFDLKEKIMYYKSIYSYP